MLQWIAKPETPENSSSIIPSETVNFERRQALAVSGLGIAGMLLAPKFAFAAPRIIKPAAPAIIKRTLELEKKFSLHNAHTGETYKGVFWAEGKFIKEELKHINYLLRDHHNNQVETINPKLLQLLHSLQEKLHIGKSFDVICGYRSPATNRMLRKTSRGVAKDSQHMYGNAVDIRLKGVDLKKLVLAARSLKAGGVGGYRKGRFVHVDVRPRPYYWGSV